MRYLYTLLFCCIITPTLVAQEIEPEAFKADIGKLYTSAKAHFKDIKKGEPSNMDGMKKYETELVLNGAQGTYLTVDAENSATYVANYTMKNIRDPKAKVEEIAAMMSEATSEFGLELSKTTDIKYVGYQKYIIEFPADNIDDMGKHPAFSIGLLQEGNPMEFEITVIDPLWK